MDSIRRTLAELGFRPSKGRGQNFLVHPETAMRIAHASSAPFATAVEIGPGLGMLTGALLERQAQVEAVEIDRRLCGYLRQRFRGNPRLNLVESDALKLDWNRWLSDTPGPRALFGNLPYSVAAPLMEKMFQHTALFSEAILCLQSDVADRVVSAGGRGMGPLTLLSHRFCSRREKLFHVPAGGFWPTPKVVSTVIRLVLRQDVPWTELDRRIPRMIFTGRRKKLSSVLPADILTGLDGRPLSSLRIDELDVEEAFALAERMRTRHRP